MVIVTLIIIIFHITIIIIKLLLVSRGACTRQKKIFLKIYLEGNR